MSIKDLAQQFSGGVLEKAMLIIHEALGAEEIDSISSAEKTRAVLQSAAAGNIIGGKLLMDHAITVQYNPSSIAFNANAEAIPFSYLQQNIDAGVPNQNLRPPMVVLTVDLFFDAMDSKDSFMLDKLRLASANDMVNTGRMAKAAVTGQGFHYTVQPQTNGLLATVLRPSTRIVTFCWGEMTFTGQVIEAQADYTMFSVSGRPVRSKIRLNIAQQVESKADQKYWDAAMEKVFGDKSLSYTRFTKSTDQQLGNLLNLNIL